MAGVLTGNALGVLRVGLTAYLLGTHSRADSLAVALGPLVVLFTLVVSLGTGVLSGLAPALSAARTMLS